MEKNRVLIITYYYKQKNAMASVRAIKLSTYLSRLGHEVTVLTSNQRDTWTKSYLCPEDSPEILEIYAPELPRWTFIQKYLAHRGERGRARAATSRTSNTAQETSTLGTTSGLKRKVKRFLSWLFYFNIAKQEDICMFYGLKKEVRARNLRNYDVVIATYPSYGAFLTGMWMRKTGRCKKMIADFRDPLYNPGFRDRKAEAKYDYQCLQKVVHTADELVCVSQGIADGIKHAVPDVKKPCSVITNGYDPDDALVLPACSDLPDDNIHFVYTGTLYHGRRCVDMLCQALKKLIEAGPIQKNSFVFEYAGPDYDELFNQLSRYGFADCANDHGMVSRQESIALQQRADALLLLTWNDKNYQGVVPGKLFEYMTCKSKPIIALVTGDVSNSEVSRIIGRADCGIACEQAAGAEDLLKLENYLEQLFHRDLKHAWHVDYYSYEHIAKEYSQHF